MKIDYCVVGPVQTNCYIIEDAGEVIVVDPGDNATIINSIIAGRPVKEIVVTHFHFDHMSALAGLMQMTGAPSAMSETDAALVEGRERMDGHDISQGCGPVHIDRLLHEGDEVTVGNAMFKVIETPGHSEGSICLYDAENKVLLAGDTIFAGGSYGRTDFMYSSPEDMVRTLGTKFVDVPDDVQILSGHMGSSIMGRERKLNPYLN